MYRTKRIGNTIIRKEIRQHESDDIRQQISTYLILISKDYFPIDTGFFTASFLDNARLTQKFLLFHQLCYQKQLARCISSVACIPVCQCDSTTLIKVTLIYHCAT